MRDRAVPQELSTDRYLLQMEENRSTLRLLETSSFTELAEQREARSSEAGQNHHAGALMERTVTTSPKTPQRLPAHLQFVNQIT